MRSLRGKRRAKSLAALLLAPALLLQALVAGLMPGSGEASTDGQVSLVICAASGGTQTIQLDQEPVPGKGDSHSCCVGFCQAACAFHGAVLASELGLAFPETLSTLAAFQSSPTLAEGPAGNRLPDARAPPLSV